jgi:solute carrier family 25 phosphate transporter 3
MMRGALGLTALGGGLFAVSKTRDSLATVSNAPLATSPTMHSMDYYLKCMFGGVLACGMTHTAVVSLDVAKCRAQAHSKAGNWPSGLVAGLKKISAEEGAAGLVKGWAPTFVGYSLQGLFKFGLNEFFKDLYTGFLGGPDSPSLEAKWQRMVLWAAASGSAEIFADMALCPFEMTKVKMQVTLPGQPNAPPSTFFGALSFMKANAADTRFPFGSLTPLWGRQVLYTMIKFVGFYLTAEFVYDTIEARTGKVKADISEGTQLLITFACGYWAGIFCAIATQPMDNLVSMKGIPENKNKPWGQMASEMGTKDLFTKGLGTRVLMIGTLTGLQWWIYGAWKSMCGLGTS